MDRTHPERLGIREQGLILEPRVEYSPVVSTPSRRVSPGRYDDDILVQLQSKAPGIEARGKVHEIMGSSQRPVGTAHHRSPRAASVPSGSMILEPGKAIAEAGIRPVFHAAKPQTLDKRLDILGGRWPRAWDPQRRDPQEPQD